jgi:hypothetical protein
LDDEDTFEDDGIVSLGITVRHYPDKFISLTSFNLFQTFVVVVGNHHHTAAPPAGTIRTAQTWF